MTVLKYILPFLFFSFASAKEPVRVIGYYCGQSIPPDSFEITKLTHVIYSFSNLCGNRICLHSSADTLLIQKFVALKKVNPSLKVMISMGGWGGCEHCSSVFNTAEGRSEFVESVKSLSDYFHLDGLDMDWEYPTVKGFPGHLFQPADKDNFTLLFQELRKTTGPKYLLSFAAGGYTDFIDSAVDWKSIEPVVDFINIMSYDLVHGFSNVSGHHTPLYSTPQQRESTDHAVQLLLAKGIPADKLIIGAAFYGRIFQILDNENGLYKPCKFLHAFSWKNIDETITAEKGYVKKFDPVAKAPYAINEEKHLLVSYDDETSVALKTDYVVSNHLGGIMFWQMYDDKLKNGLLDIIDQQKRKK